MIEKYRTIAAVLVIKRRVTAKKWQNVNRIVCFSNMPPKVYVFKRLPKTKMSSIPELF